MKLRNRLLLVAALAVITSCATVSDRWEMTYADKRIIDTIIIGDFVRRSPNISSGNGEIFADLLSFHLRDKGYKVIRLRSGASNSDIADNTENALLLDGSLVLNEYSAGLDEKYSLVINTYLHALNPRTTVGQGVYISSSSFHDHKYIDSVARSIVGKIAAELNEGKTHSGKK